MLKSWSTKLQLHFRPGFRIPDLSFPLLKKSDLAHKTQWTSAGFTSHSLQLLLHGTGVLSKLEGDLHVGGLDVNGIHCLWNSTSSSVFWAGFPPLPHL